MYTYGRPNSYVFHCIAGKTILLVSPLSYKVRVRVCCSCCGDGGAGDVEVDVIYVTFMMSTQYKAWHCTARQGKTSVQLN